MALDSMTDGMTNEALLKTKIRWGFKGKNQSPWFMIWKEYIVLDDVVFAKVLFQIGR